MNLPLHIPHVVTSPGGAAYSCVCDINQDHDVDAWVTCPACRYGIEAGDVRQHGGRAHLFDQGCYFREAVRGPDVLPGAERLLTAPPITGPDDGPAVRDVRP